MIFLRMQLLVATLTFGFSPVGFAHARLKNLTMRNNNDGNKEPSRPCGPGTRNVNPTTFAPGQKIQVQWEETINHAGRFEFYFSEGGDQNFKLLQTIQDTQTGPMPHQYNAEIQLPNIQCTACTLQMIQVMLDNPNNPSNYYSCADIRLAIGGNTGGNSGPAQNPNPTTTLPSSSKACR